jgi:hypothetical protein
MFLDCIKFGFELFIVKMFEMNFFLNDPIHISCHIPFESDSLSKC